MALRDVLSRFRSISRPSLSGGSSSAYASLAKKTQAAEDAILDNQYEAGDLSPEFYLTKLQERYLRPTMTPLQRVNINEKIENVKVAVVDADVSRRYAAGELTTKDVLDYEKTKLDGMTEPGSAAYIKQQQKVQGLTDKAEKEQRTQFRISENLRISRMPEDTSQNLWEKAQLYQTLSEQARLDGDTQQADTLLTQANNYVNSAKKADVNDLITGARLSVSQTPTQGLGVPQASGVSTAGSGLKGNGSATTPSAVNTTISSSGYQTPAVLNAQKSLDRQQKTIERLYGQLGDNQTLIAQYEKAISQATGDQKTSLQISLNNLIDAGKGIQNQIDNTIQNINDTVVRIQELQEKAALAEFKQEVRINNGNFDKAETELEKSFREGKIGKEEYIMKGAQLAFDKANYQSQASEVFGQQGEDSLADSYYQKSAETNQVVDTLVNVAENINDYEPLAVEPGGKITNLFGKSLKPGEVALTNVRNLKDSGVFQRQYAAEGGKFYKVHFEGTDKDGNPITDANGDLLPAYVNQDLSKFNDTSYIYKVDENGQVIGKGDPKTQVKFASIANAQGKPIQRPFTASLFDKMKSIGSITQDKSGAWIQTPDPKGGGIFAGLQGGYNKLGAKVGDFLLSLGIGGESKLEGKLPTNAVQQVTDFIKGKPGAQQNVQRQSVPGLSFKLPKLVSEVQASDQVPGGLGGSIGDIIDKVAEEMKPGDLEFKKVMHAIALAESGGNPNAVGDNGQSIGLYQNRMKLGRGGNYSKEQLLDPEFNTRLAAKELVVYYDQAVKKGLKGADVVAYTSKYGQRPAPGNERQAAAKYGNFVSRAINSVKNTIEAPGRVNSAVKSYGNLTTETLADPKKTKDIALALGIKPEQYRTGLKQDQAAVDRAFRSDQRTQDLLRSEGLKPSWETQSSSIQSKPIASVQQSQPQPQKQNIIQSISSGVSNVAKNISSGVQNIASNIKLPQISLPKISIPKISAPMISSAPNASKPSVLQNIGYNIQQGAKVATDFAKNTISKITNLFKKK